MCRGRDAAGLVVLTCDPSSRLRGADKHIDKDLSALVFGIRCFILQGMMCARVYFARTGREGHLSL